MNIWDEIFYSVLNNEKNFSSGTTTYAPPEPESQYKFSETIFNLFMAGAQDTSIPDMLKVFLMGDWYVRINPNNAYESITAKPGENLMMLESPQSEGRKKSKSVKTKGGKGGKLVPLYSISPATPNLPAIHENGRKLIRNIAADIDGLLVHVNTQPPYEINRENFDLMRTIADECDLEECIVSPGPDQLRKLLDGQWWVEVNSDTDKPELKSVISEARIVYARTEPDRAKISFAKRIPMKGEDLFRAVVNNPEADGLVIDGVLGTGDLKLFNPVYSINCLSRMLEGFDARVGVNPLPARSLAEIELWLSLRGFPQWNRRLLDASSSGQALVRAFVPEGHNWNQNESLGSQCFRSVTWSPVFSLPTSSGEGFGIGASEILCPGLLARELNATAYRYGAFPEKYWERGRNLIFGRLLNKTEIEMSKQRLAIAKELEKLLPEGADRIPRTMMRTVAGAALMRKHPHAATRAWIEGTVKQAERYTKTWVPA